MAIIDEEFSTLCSKILKEGRIYVDTRRDVERLQIPSYTFRHSFSDGFPAITNKKLYWRGIVTEALWFLRGDNDITFLNSKGVKIWNQDAYNWYIKHYKQDPQDPNGAMDFDTFDERGTGSVGQNYSVQWRNFNGETDQIANLVRDMKENIMSSRLKVNAWNPSEVDKTALPPCHSEFQVIGIPLTLKQKIEWVIANTNIDAENLAITDEALSDRVPQFGFELHWNQRSVDTFLGLPFNIASYALIAKILEKLTGFPALGIEGTLKCVHFYDNQYEAVQELISRDTSAHKGCRLRMPAVWEDNDLDKILSSFHVTDFILEGYTSDKSIPVKMMAPKDL